MNAPHDRYRIVSRLGAFVLGGVLLCLVGCSTPRTSTALVLRDVEGRPQQPLVHADEKVTALFFVLHDCPLAKTCAPEINRIVAEYEPRGVRCYLVYGEPELSAEQARKHATDFGYSCPVLLDPAQDLARFTGATISPEVAVLSPASQLLYRGRIDDRLTAFGKQRVEPARRDLREALDAILDGRAVPNRVTKAVGCYLPAGNFRRPDQ